MRMRFWLRQCGEELLYGIGIAVAFLFVTTLQSETPLRELLFMLPLYFLVGTILMTSIVLTGSYKLPLPLALSMGSTRRECFWGMQIMKLLPSVAASVLSWASLRWVVPGGRDLLPLLTVLFFVALAACALGDLIAMAGYRWGKFGGLLGFLAVIVLCGGTGGLFGAGLGGDVAWLLSLIREPGGAMTAAAAIAGVLLLITLPLEHVTLRQMEVRL